MKKVAQANDAGFIVSNKAEDVVVAYSPVDEPAEEKVSKRTSKKAKEASFDVEAKDGDGDGYLQDGTVHERIAESVEEVAEEEPAVEAK